MIRALAAGSPVRLKRVKLSARFLLLKSFKINQTQRFTDYKRFDVETSSEIKPPEP